jgi:hypothetical protein
MSRTPKFDDTSPSVQKVIMAALECAIDMSNDISVEDPEALTIPALKKATVVMMNQLFDNNGTFAPEWPADIIAAIDEVINQKVGFAILKFPQQ